MEVDSGTRCGSIANRRRHDMTMVSLGRQLGIWGERSFINGRGLGSDDCFELNVISKRG